MSFFDGITQKKPSDCFWPIILLVTLSIRGCGCLPVISNTCIVAKQHVLPKKLSEKANLHGIGITIYPYFYPKPMTTQSLDITVYVNQPQLLQKFSVAWQYSWPT